MEIQVMHKMAQIESKTTHNAFDKSDISHSFFIVKTDFQAMSQCFMLQHRLIYKSKMKAIMFYQ